MPMDYKDPSYKFYTVLFSVVIFEVIDGSRVGNLQHDLWT